MIIPNKFFARPAYAVAPDLLGHKLVRLCEGERLEGLITEVEAYHGEDDLACHASRGRTKRTEVLYWEPGTLYAYFVYGMYWCLNIVTGEKGYPSAVLIRGAEPLKGRERMSRNRGCRGGGNRAGISDGPGKLCQAFSITGDINGRLLGRDTVWIEDGGALPGRHIVKTPRIGVGYAKECAEYPWRFVLRPEKVP